MRLAEASRAAISFAAPVRRGDPDELSIDSRGVGRKWRKEAARGH